MVGPSEESGTPPTSSSYPVPCGTPKHRMVSLTWLIALSCSPCPAQLRWPGPPSRRHPMVSHMGFHVGYPIVNVARHCQLARVRNVPPPEVLSACCGAHRLWLPGGLFMHARDSRSACDPRDRWFRMPAMRLPGKSKRLTNAIASLDSRKFR